MVRKQILLHTLEFQETTDKVTLMQEIKKGEQELFFSYYKKTVR
jgi:hypothetical protein